MVLQSHNYTKKHNDNYFWELFQVGSVGGRGWGGGGGEDIGIRDINPKTLRWYTCTHN